MFVAELFEGSPTQLVVIYPGRFQPFHKGHKAVYDRLVAKYGRDAVFIASSDKQELPKSPFSFNDKAKFMHATGVPDDRIIQSKQPYQVPELKSKLNLDNTVMIFAVSQKDMDEDPRFSFKTTKNGNPSYFQPLPDDLRKTQPATNHAYIAVVPTEDFTVAGEPMRSASQIRDKYKSSDESTRRLIIKDLFGAYTPELQHILDSKLLADSVNEHIVKVKDGYRLVSKKTGRNLGTYPTRAGAEKRERQVQYFKHANEDLETVNETFYFQGYQIDVDPRTKILTVSRGGQVLHTEKTSMVGRPGGAESIKRRVSIIIDRLEDEKFPDDLEARHSTEKDAINLDQVSDMIPKMEDAAGVGVVATNKKMAKDPRYSTSMTVDVHPDTPKKNMKAMGLIETDREPHQQVIDRLEQRLVDNIRDKIDEIKNRVAKEKITSEHKASLLKQVEKLRNDIREIYGFGK